MSESDLEERRAAVALRYRPEEDSAPKVVAGGRGTIAEQIIRMAEKCGIPIHEDRSLVEVLSKLELGAEIPAELYRVVAEILAFVYRMDRGWRGAHGMQ